MVATRVGSAMAQATRHDERQCLPIYGNDLVVEKSVKEMSNQKLELLLSCRREQGVIRLPAQQTGLAMHRPPS